MSGERKKLDEFSPLLSSPPLPYWDPQRWGGSMLEIFLQLSAGLQPPSHPARSHQVVRVVMQAWKGPFFPRSLLLSGAPDEAFCDGATSPVFYPVPHPPRSVWAALKTRAFRMAQAF